MYTVAPIKRMSILERRKGDSLEYFSRHWREVHGGMIAAMPHLFAYVQNHVLEDFPGDHPALPADGLVEQLWRSAAEMQRGYNSAMVPGMIADEANYLGHGSNYAILAQAPLREAPEGGKLIVALRHGGNVDLADLVAETAGRLCPDLLRDDVIATIAKANFLPVPPRPVDMFLHLCCADPGQAGETGRTLVRSLSGQISGAAALGVWRVATATIVEPERVTARRKRP